jgi:hypothetical protein
MTHCSRRLNRQQQWAGNEIQTNQKNRKYLDEIRHHFILFVICAFLSISLVVLLPISTIHKTTRSACGGNMNSRHRFFIRKPTPRSPPPHAIREQLCINSTPAPPLPLGSSFLTLGDLQAQGPTSYDAEALLFTPWRGRLPGKRRRQENFPLPFALYQDVPSMLIMPCVASLGY